MYVRNFGVARFGPTWQAAFQTDRREEVDAYCLESDIRAEWIDEDRLRATQTRPALLTHPQTGEEVWFNHAATLHVSSLPARTRRVLMKLLDESDYPSHTYYGDGAPIEPEVLDEVRDAYGAERVLVEWKVGDVLVLDNILTAHGRLPFKGHREVVVAMTGASGWRR
jgi:alpha-ketoglutarate-dependent taurine dioxygenase